MGERHCLWGLLCTLALLLWDSSDVTKAFSLTPGPASRAAPRAPRALRAELRPRPAEERLQLFSPAKVNLFLRIIRKREDGYHDLASLFHTVAFGDSLQLEVLPEDAKKDKLECNLPGAPVDESNLVIRSDHPNRGSPAFENVAKRLPGRQGMDVTIRCFTCPGPPRLPAQLLRLEVAETAWTLAGGTSTTPSSRHTREGAPQE